MIRPITTELVRRRARQKRTRGFTLVELVIVLAVTGIALTMIGTLLTLTARHVAQAQRGLEADEELALADLYVRDWFYTYDSAGNQVIASSGALVALSYAGDELGRLSFDEGTQSVYYSAAGQDSAQQSFKYLQRITFEAEGDVVRVEMQYDGGTYPHNVLLARRTTA